MSVRQAQSSVGDRDGEEGNSIARLIYVRCLFRWESFKWHDVKARQEERATDARKFKMCIVIWSVASKLKATNIFQQTHS